MNWEEKFLPLMIRRVPWKQIEKHLVINMKYYVGNIRGSYKLCSLRCMMILLSVKLKAAI